VAADRRRCFLVELRADGLSRRPPAGEPKAVRRTTDVRDCPGSSGARGTWRTGAGVLARSAGSGSGAGRASRVLVLVEPRSETLESWCWASDLRDWSGLPCMQEDRFLGRRFLDRARFRTGWPWCSPSGRARRSGLWCSRPGHGSVRDRNRVWAWTASDVASLPRAWLRAQTGRGSGRGLGCNSERGPGRGSGRGPCVAQGAQTGRGGARAPSLFGCVLELCDREAGTARNRRRTRQCTRRKGQRGRVELEGVDGGG
jgi:hypothetical protein